MKRNSSMNTIDFLKDLSEQLLTQDNHCTSSPLYDVQAKILVTGIGLEYSDNIGWFSNEEGGMVSEKKHLALERYYERFDKEPDEYTRTGYEYRWEHVNTFLTATAAQANIARNKHNYLDLRMYVESACRNPQMREVRRLLAKPLLDCVLTLQAIARGEYAEGEESTMAQTALAEFDSFVDPYR